GSYDKAISLFSLLSTVDYADSAQRIREVRESKAADEAAAAEALRQKQAQQYSNAMTAMEQQDYAAAIPILQELSKASYKDSAAQLIAAQNGERQQRYDAADALLQEGRQDEALAAFSRLAEEEFSDSVTRVRMIRYAIAEQMLGEGKYKQAMDEFAAAVGYSDAASRIQECHYLMGEAHMAAGQYQQASIAFAAAGSYQDAATRRQEADYQQALCIEAESDYYAAYTAFTALGRYRDSAEKASLNYEKYAVQQAEELMAENSYEKAIEMLRPYCTSNPDAQKLYWNALFRLNGTVTPMSVDGTGWVKGEDGNYALIDTQGNVITIIDYAAIQDWSDGLCLCYNQQNTEITRAAYFDSQGRNPFGREFKNAESFLQGKALVTTMDDRRCVIDTTGAEVCELPVKEGREYLSYLGETMISFSENGKTGVMNLQGKVIVKPRYSSICRYQYGLSEIFLDGKHGLLNAKGKEVIKPGKYPEFVLLGENMIAAKKKQNGNFQIMNLKGQVFKKVAKRTYTQAERKGDLIIVREEGYCRVYNLELDYTHQFIRGIDVKHVGYQSAALSMTDTEHSTMRLNINKSWIAATSLSLSGDAQMSPESPYIVWKMENRWVIRNSTGSVIY
ncbi:MAG: WG repeat-containing protein, partial [Clostridia bacterium]|nr:WG repeat-containing protein [Clostridia bacterium]